MPKLAVKRNVLPLSSSLSAADASPHQLAELLADGQPQPRASILAGKRGVCLIEGLEEVRDLLRTHADAGVRDRELQARMRSGRYLLRCHLHQDRALVGELDGIVDQIDEDLAQPQGIADEEAGRLLAPPRTSRAMPFSSAFWPTMSSRLRSSTSSSENAMCSSSSLPASIFEKSRMSFMMPSRDCAALPILVR